ncbi:unnamed protein product [Lactuca saligna]|uniref:Uncharacterized protein n=1 Tax=Lactuca saligna TaxID=75948 RepID=A0AA35VJC8_LACSI|nr:unnamed protein product [Lactuca saligna]
MVGYFDVSVKTLYVDTAINHDDQSKESNPQKTTVVPPEVSNAKSVTEGVRISGIPMNISNMDTNVTMVNDDATTDDVGFMGTFAYLKFDPEEENIPNLMLMSGKYFKILNRKSNSLLQLQADAGGCHSLSGIKVGVMLKGQELRLKDELDIKGRNNQKHVKAQSSSFHQ